MRSRDAGEISCGAALTLSEEGDSPTGCPPLLAADSTDTHDRTGDGELVGDHRKQVALIVAVHDPQDTVESVANAKLVRRWHTGAYAWRQVYGKRSFATPNRDQDSDGQ